MPEPKPLHHLSDTKFIEELKRFAGTPAAVLENKQLMEVFLPILRADFTVDETYVFQEKAPLDCPITAFVGADDPEAKEEEMKAWKDHTSGAFKLEILEGDHFFLQTQREPLLEHIAAIVKRMGESK